MPSAAILRLVSLLPVLPPPHGSATEPPAEPAPELADYERKKLKWRLTEITIAEYPLQEKLERCQNRLAQARRCLHALPTLRAALPDEWAQRRLALLEAEAESVLRNDARTPALLTLQLNVLAFEAAEIKRLLSTTD